jgi:hypothetical protein
MAYLPLELTRMLAYNELISLRWAFLTSESGRNRLPPYISYRTFQNFVDRLEHAPMPSRFDRSFWGDMFSGSTGVQLMSGLRFLSFVNTDYTPTPRLRKLIGTKGEARIEFLKEMTQESYDFLFKGPFDLQTATYSQFQEVFNERFQAANDVTRKCVKFFVALAESASIPLSPYISRRFRSASGTSGTKAPVKRISTKSNRNLVVPQTVPEIFHSSAPWQDMLLSKFPAFDPSWSEEVKLNWFKAFEDLMKMGQNNGMK